MKRSLLLTGLSCFLFILGLFGAVFGDVAMITLLITVIVFISALMLIGRNKLLAWYRTTEEGKQLLEQRRNPGISQNKSTLFFELVAASKAYNEYRFKPCESKRYDISKVDSITEAINVKQEDLPKKEQEQVLDQLPELNLNTNFRQRVEDHSILIISLSDKHNLSLPAYARSVRSVVFEVVNIVLQIYKRSHSAIFRTEQMVNQVDSTFDVLNDVNSVAEETSLLALNVFFDAAKRGNSGVGSMTIADEVKKLSAHSKNFTDEIRREVDVAKKTINEVKDLISKTADKELLLILKEKESIDGELSKLTTLDKLSADCLGDGGNSELAKYLSIQSKEALNNVVNSLEALTSRIHIVTSKQAVTQEESERLLPILKLSQELQAAMITE